MRDLLTVLATLVIAVLTAALVVPPFIDWGARRGALESAFARATGTEVETEGRITVRLLPSPQIRVDRLRVGPADASSPSLTATILKAEVALAPLLSGEVRFTETRIGRAEIRLPASREGTWQMPAGLVPGEGSRSRWAFEDLFVGQLLVTTTTPTTGRTDQIYAENVHIGGQSLIGPWRLEGMTGGVPFRLVTGELTADHTIQIKLAGGGNIHPRFDIDALIALQGDTKAGAPSVTGTAKVFFGPPAQVAAAGLPIPVAFQTSFKTADGAVLLDPISVEAGEGGASLRLTGTGSIRLDDPRVSLRLEGRRLDVDSFILSASGRQLAEQSGTWSPPPITVPIDLELALNSIGFAQDELSNLTARLTLLRGQAKVERIEFEAPGQTRIAASGEFGLTTSGGANGRIAIASTTSDRFARYLGNLGLSGPLTAVLDGRPLEASADMAHTAPVTAFRNVRVKVGDATLTGTARYTAPEEGRRGKLEAQVAVRDLDLAQLPQVNSVFEATQNLDIGFILDARDVRHGGSKGAGRIAARILSDAPALVVETLEITDLAGANARVSGRIAPDGSGRIEGTVSAQRAAPLVDLTGSVWVGDLSKLVPPFLREGGLDLAVVAERGAPDPRNPGLRLRTTATGTAAGGRFEAEVLTADGLTERLNVRLATDNTGRWVERPDTPALRRPSNLDVRGVRVPSGNFNVTVAGDVGGMRIATTRPFALATGDEVVDSGEADLTSSDITPFLILLGDGAGVNPPVPTQIRVTLGRERDASLLMVSGRVGDTGVQARLSARSRADVAGTVTLDRLSLPWAAAAFALNAPADPRATALWSTTRFGQTRRVITGGQMGIKVGRLEFGRGLVGDDATFTLTVTPEEIGIRDLSAGLGGGQITGALSISRQEALASVIGEGTIRDVPINTLVSPSPFEARLSGNLRFGASGEAMSALVANLAGAGEFRMASLVAARADAGAVERGVARALREEDPLAVRRLETLVTEELSRGPFRATGVTAPATLVGGVLRLSPVVAQAEGGAWQGVATIDLKSLNLDARGILNARTAPPGWTGSPPYITLGWSGPVTNPRREVDVGPLTNGVAAVVLQRELAKIEAFEADTAERNRTSQRRDMDRAREQAKREAEEAARRAAEEAARRAAEEAARQKAAEEAARRAEEAARRAADEAARQARLREQQEDAARQARIREQQEEAARQARARQQEVEAERARMRAPPPLEIRPAPQIGSQPGG